jgi:glycosyltransferase involved in cell wall biosynthesis
MKLTIAINCRSDKRLTWTLDNIERATYANDRPDVVVVFDGNQKRPDLTLWPFVRAVQTGKSAMGTSYARHLGVMEARHEAVITCDSHIDFVDDALPKMLKAINESPFSLICGVCRMRGETGDHDYYGADLFEYVGGEPDGTTVRGKGECVAVAGKWRKSTDTGTIDCIMGGCYGLTRRTYIDAGEPWKYGKGWGCDEESASVAWAACGYARLCIPAVVVHEYQAKPSYNPSPDDIANVWYNRYRVAAMVCRGDKAKLMDMIAFMATSCGKPIHDRAMKALNDIEPWIEYINGRSMAFYDKPKPIGRKERVDSALVVDKGIECRKCGERFAMRITHTWPNGNRRGICERCGRIHTIVRENKLQS